MRVERCVEVAPFGYPFTTRATSCSYGPLWPVPMRINVIQYSMTGDGRKQLRRPGAVERGPVTGFDLVPCRVVMKVDQQLTPRFDASEETRECVRRRELRLTPYAFGPATDPSINAIETAVEKQISRIRKYETTYGFKLPARPLWTPSDGDATPALAASNA